MLGFLLEYVELVWKEGFIRVGGLCEVLLRMYRSLLGMYRSLLGVCRALVQIGCFVSTQRIVVCVYQIGLYEALLGICRALLGTGLYLYTEIIRGSFENV